MKPHETEYRCMSEILIFMEIDFFILLELSNQWNITREHDIAHYGFT